MSRGWHQLVMLSHTLDQRVWILKLISHSPSYPGGHTRTLRCSGWGGERRIKWQASSASAGSEQTGRMRISCWHWLPNSSTTAAVSIDGRSGGRQPSAKNKEIASRWQTLCDNDNAHVCFKVQFSLVLNSEFKNSNPISNI